MHEVRPAGPATSSISGDPLEDSRLMVQLIAEVTGRPADEVSVRLREEYERPGSTVAAEFRQRQLTPYVFSEDVARFYSDSDAFVYESAVWNCNRIKRDMRRWTGRRLDRFRAQRGGEPLDVLCIGDGLGFDSASFADRGHRVTYHEVPGFNEAFARRVFEHTASDVRIETEPDRIARGAFDAVVCLDVLEHVPDPPAFIDGLLEYLKRDGRLIVHAPFYMIHPAYPTHLKANRRYSGSLRLFTQAGLRLIDGKLGWNPLVFERSGASPPQRLPALKGFALRCAGACLSLGRWSSLLTRPIHWHRCRRARRFA